MAALVASPPSSPGGGSALNSPRSLRPSLKRVSTCPSPRPPPLQYISPSSQLRPSYLEDGSVKTVDYFSTSGDNNMSIWQQSLDSVFNADFLPSTMATASSQWPVTSTVSTAQDDFSWNSMSMPVESIGAPYTGYDSVPHFPAFSNDVANYSAGFDFDYFQYQPVHSSAHVVVASGEFPTTAPNFLAASANALLTEQTLLLEDAKANSSLATPGPGQRHDPVYVHSNLAVRGTKTKQNPENKVSSAKTKIAPKAKARSAQKQGQWNLASSKPQYSDGKVVGSMEVWAPAFKVAKPKSKRDLENAATVRKHGACPEHKRSHKRCVLTFMPYLLCLTAKSPRFFSNLDEIQFFRKGPVAGHPLESKRTELFALQQIEGAGPGATQIRLSQGLGHELVVYVTEYKPRPGDKLDHVWYKDGQRREIRMPPLCLTFLDMTQANIANYIENCASIYLQDIIQNSGDFTRTMLLRAIEFAATTGSATITSALNLLAVNRMIERDWRVTNPSGLDFPLINDEACPWVGARPVTPMMDTGLDQIVIKGFLNRYREQVLSGLVDMMSLEKKQDCFEIVLTVFVLATNTEWLLRHSRRNAKRYMAKNRYSSIPLAQGYFHSHNILLSHFHYLIRNSATPASRKNPVFVPQGSSLSADEAHFLRQVQDAVTAQVPYASQLRAKGRYETEFHFSHQLFLRDWAPGTLEILDDHLD